MTEFIIEVNKQQLVVQSDAPVLLTVLTRFGDVHRLWLVDADLEVLKL